MAANYDMIVLGLGGMGSAALFELARRGHRVLGLEQFRTVHDRGSSHGQTRIIRRAYYEHPAYVPLATRAYQRWYELEQITGRHLFTECGCLSIGAPESELIAGVQQSAREHQLAVEALPAKELAARFPAFRWGDHNVGILERGAGFLYVEECVRAHLDAAAFQGATVLAEEPVLEWKAQPDHVEVRTAKQTYHAARLVITAGAWAARLLSDIGVPLTVMRQVLLWFDVARHAELFRRDRFPTFISQVPSGQFYGFPAIDRYGFKVARHYGVPELSGPEEVNWYLQDADSQPVREYLDAYLPGKVGELTRGQVCMYTLSPNRHFIIDTHPGFPQVSLAAGFSGHGFKFASMIGEILADLAEKGRSDLPIDMFRQCRRVTHD